jgi:exodeoxyribonuclease-3
MLIATWNVNSIKARHEHLGAWLDRRRPDVVCLQELKSVEAKLPVELFTSRGYQLEALGQPTYNGVAIASLRPITDVERGLPEGDEGQARVISGVVDGVRVVCAYCPQGSDVESPKFAYKLRFFDALIPHIAARLANGPLILAGDINIAPLPDDVWDDVEMKDQVSYHPLEHERFRALGGPWAHRRGEAAAGAPHLHLLGLPGAVVQAQARHANRSPAGDGGRGGAGDRRRR